MCYNAHTADLMAVGASNEIYRLNLSLGRFQSPFESDSPEVNCISYSDRLELACTGGIDGRVEFWNTQSKAKVHGLLFPGTCKDQEITQV